MADKTPDHSEVFKKFLEQVKPNQILWALQDKVSEDWVVLDSFNFEETDVMPLWSTEELAKAHCSEEWQGYSPAAITLADWLEFWIEDLSSDGVIVGINWPTDGGCLELDQDEFTQGLVEIEKLKH
jgi:hypothetical protein